MSAFESPEYETVVRPSPEFGSEPVGTATPVTESANKSKEDDLPLVLLTFALHISDQDHRDAEETCPLKNKEAEVGSANRAKGFHPRQRKFPARATEIKTIPSTTTTLALPTRRKPFAKCENQFSKFGVSKVKTIMCRYSGDEKENIPPPRRVSFSLDL